MNSNNRILKSNYHKNSEWVDGGKAIAGCGSILLVLSGLLHGAGKVALNPNDRNIYLGTRNQTFQWGGIAVAIGGIMYGAGKADLPNRIKMLLMDKADR